MQHLMMYLLIKCWIPPAFKQVLLWHSLAILNFRNMNSSTKNILHLNVTRHSAMTELRGLHLSIRLWESLRIVKEVRILGFRSSVRVHKWKEAGCFKNASTVWLIHFPPCLRRHPRQLKTARCRCQPWCCGSKCPGPPTWCPPGKLSADGPTARLSPRRPARSPREQPALASPRGFWTTWRPPLTTDAASSLEDGGEICHLNLDSKCQDVNQLI